MDNSSFQYVLNCLSHIILDDKKVLYISDFYDLNLKNYEKLSKAYNFRFPLLKNRVPYSLVHQSKDYWYLCIYAISSENLCNWYLSLGTNDVYDNRVNLNYDFKDKVFTNKPTSTYVSNLFDVFDLILDDDFFNETISKYGYVK